MTGSDLPAVGRTAVGVARVRAAESVRDDRLFADPYAAEFVEAFGDAGTAADALTDEQRRWRSAIAAHIVMRTRFFDDYLIAAVDGGCQQIVLLGAGLDTRAWRLEWPPATRLFEMDLPPVLSAKRQVLDPRRRPPRCTRVEVPADLTSDWRDDLLDAGFDRAQPTGWLAEGLFVYFDAAATDRALRTVTDLSADGSRIALERGDAARVAATPVNDTTALWRGGLGRNPAAWLAEHGWTAAEHELSDVAAAYHRTLPALTASGFVTARR